jgi:hypothetical protein
MKRQDDYNLALVRLSKGRRAGGRGRGRWKSGDAGVEATPSGEVGTKRGALPHRSGRDPDHVAHRAGVSCLIVANTLS